MSDQPRGSPSRRQFLRGSLTLAGLGLLAACGAPPLRRAPAAKVARIGYQSNASPSANAARLEAFRQGLRELGYVEGENVAIEYRYADGIPERIGEIAAELVRLEVDVIVTAAPSSTRVAKAATSTIPIVMAYDNDPVGNGFVASLARPGGNITGLSSFAPEISAKQLELLRAIVPGLSRVTVLGTWSLPGYETQARAMESAAGALGVQLHSLDVLGPEGLEPAFRKAGDGRADAVLVLPSPILESARTRVADLAAQHRLPAIYHAREYVEAGGLVCYGASWIGLYRRAATYVDKILKGARPADLPVEQPTTFDLVINLKTARALGLTIPQAVLDQATEVIQ